MTIGMTLDERIPAIVVGMTPGELLPPHPWQVSQNSIQRIVGYAAKKNTIRCGSATQAYHYIIDIARFNQATTVEIFGAWEDACVPQAVAMALSQGLSVRVPKGLTLPCPGVGVEEKLPYSVTIFSDKSCTYTHREDEKYWRFAPQRI